MFSGISIYTHDKIWVKILGELGADVVTTPGGADVTFVPPNGRLTPIEVKAEIIKQIDLHKKSVLGKIFGKKNPELSQSQERIVLLLYKHGGLSIKQLNEYLGYMENTKTHTSDTAIYSLRKTFGQNFITQANGIYKLGTI